MPQRYLVKGKIGQGGLGDVYLATDTQLDRDVALKRVRPPEEGSATALEQDLIREARTLSSLQHPNIVTIYDVGNDEKGPFVVMELLKGETLDQVIDRGALTVDDFREVVIQSLEGMIAAQELGLVHRDLKPGNLMVIWLASGKFQIKILDFGLAKFSLTATRQTEDQEAGIMGTIYFMAPEQFERLPLDARTDMYSLGCIFYQILTTKAPFDGQTGPEVMVSHLQHHVMHLVEARPDLPAWMADWVMWLISRDMDERPPDARTALDYFRESRSGIKNPTPQVVIPQGPTVKIVGRGSGPGPITTVIRTGKTTQRLPGNATQRMQGTSATARSSRPAAKKVVRKKSNAGLWITLLVLAAGGAGAGWFLSRPKVADHQTDAALEAVLSAPAPSNNAATWKLLFSAIRSNGPEAPKAAAVLKKMSGAPFASAVAAELGEATGAARLIFMEAIAEHPSAAGNAQLIKVATAESGMVRAAALESLVKTATPADLEALLRILPKIKEPANRTLFFRTVAAALGRDPEAPNRARPLVAALPLADNASRPEILRLLGQTGDPAAATAINAELTTSGDRRQTALSALTDWAVPLPSTAEALLAAAAAPTDRQALLTAFCNFAPRISSWNGADFVAAMRKAWPLVNSTKNREAFGEALGSNASSEAAAYARELAADPEWTAMAAKAEKSIAVLQAGITVVVIGENHLDASKAVILGVEKDVYYTSTSRYVTNWNDPASRIAWDITVPAAGTASIQVLQSGSSRAHRTFRIRLGDGLVETPVKPTPSNEDFLPVEAGKFQIPRPGSWRLWLEPAQMEPGQPLVNIREIVVTFR